MVVLCVNRSVIKTTTFIYFYKHPQYNILCRRFKGYKILWISSLWTIHHTERKFGLVVCINTHMHSQIPICKSNSCQSFSRNSLIFTDVCVLLLLKWKTNCASCKWQWSWVSLHATSAVWLPNFKAASQADSGTWNRENLVDTEVDVEMPETRVV